MSAIRVYADTSVFGGVFDDEFAEASAAFFEAVRAGRFTLVVSALIWDELEDAPQEVRDLFGALRAFAEVVDPDAEAITLQRAYIDAGILGPNWETDALHVALATVSGCRMIVSWNFKHIVHYRKIPMYNGVNLVHGYPPVGIHTPREVIDEED
jgi:hypothetical protein